MPANGNKKVVIVNEAVEELAQLRELTGLPDHELIRHSIVLLRIYADGKQKGYESRVVNPKNPDSDYALLEMPLLISTQRNVKRSRYSNE